MPYLKKKTMDASKSTEEIPVILPSSKDAKGPICLVQITRLEGLIQTAFVARELKKIDNDIQLFLVARYQFAHPLQFLLKDIFDKVFLLNTESIVHFQNPDLKSSLSKITRFLDKINSKSISTLVNLSYSPSSYYLCSLIEANLKIGPYYGKDLNIIINDGWSQFVYANVLNGPLCPFSLIDLYKNILGISNNTNEPLTSNKTNQQLKDNGPIIIHPFSSQSRKMWKIEKWIEIIYKTLKDNSDKTIIIVGDKSEVKLSKNIVNNSLLKNYKTQLINKAGRTSLKQLGNLIKSSSLFIGHDSMVGHLAAFYNIQTLSISLGSARPIETGPYSNKGYNIAPRIKCFPCFPQYKCNYYQCHYDISYNIVCSAIQQLIHKKEITLKKIKEDVSLFHLDSIDLYKANLSENNHSTLTLDNLTDNHPQLNDIFRIYYKIAWNYYFNEIEEFHKFPTLNQETHKCLLNYRDGLKYLYELCEFGKKYSQDIIKEISSKTPELTKIKELSTKIQEIDNLTKIIKDNYTHLYPIIDYFLVVKSNLAGITLAQLSESSFLAHHDCSLVTSIIFELIEKNIAQYEVKDEKTIQDLKHGI